jgi:hypothetical protein
MIGLQSEAPNRGDKRRVQKQSVESIVAALNGARVRYLVVGDLAVVAHGHVRFSADLDLVLDPDRGSLHRAIEALTALGYRSRAPVPFSDFERPEKRSEWAREKGLTVFSLFSATHPTTEVDLFVEPPFDFERTYAQAVRLDVGQDVSATFVSRKTLLEMKRRAGRPQDLADIAGLEATGDSAGPHDE